MPNWLRLPSLLGLDAAWVAMVWQRTGAALLHVDLGPAPTVVLGLVVWGIYLVDRVVDAERGLAAAERHAFALRHRLALKWLAAFCALGGVALVPQLSSDLVLCGGGLALLVVGYLSAVHRPKGALGRGIRAKEVVVGFCFGIGTMLPMLGARPSCGACAAIGFGAVCWCNCRLIEEWEGRLPISARELAAMLGVAGVAAFGLPAQLVVALASLFVLLWWFDRFGSVAPRPARAGVDLAMAAVGLVWWVAA